MLWKVVPQPDGAWEDGAVVGVDRGLGNLDVGLAISSGSAEG